VGDDRRLIEDYLPIESISAEASGEPRTKGHISTLHIWRARRPLVACRAAVYAALVPQSQFETNSGGAATHDKKEGRTRAKQFIEALCRYQGSPAFVRDAEQHILKAHASRLRTIKETT
jgi:putative DNA methylase